MTNNSKSMSTLPFASVSERPELILMKGEFYKEKVEKKR